MFYLSTKRNTHLSLWARSHGRAAGWLTMIAFYPEGLKG